MNDPINILLCEPSDPAAADLVRHLKARGLSGEFRIVDTIPKASAALVAHRWDIILSAHALPDFDARKFLDVTRAIVPDLPVIVIAPTMNETLSDTLFGAGARDVISMTDLSRLVPAIRRETEARKARQLLMQATGRAELHFHNIVESSIQGIMVRAKSRTQFVNPAFCEMFGYSAEELMQLDTTLPLHPEGERGQVAERVRRRNSGDPAINVYEVQGLRKDGSIFWCSKMVSLIEWDGQSAVQIVVVDITERKNAEQQLAEQERRYRGTFESAPIAMARSGGERKIIEVNQAFTDLLGYTREELIGRRVGEYVPAEDMPPVIAKLKDLWTREVERVDVQHRVTRKDGRTIWIQSSSSLMHDDKDLAGQPQMLIQFQDITGRHEAEIALLEREARYRDLVEKSLQALLVVGTNGEALFVNDVFADTFGYSREEIFAMETAFPLYHPDDRQSLQTRHKSRVSGDNSMQRYEIRGLRKDGTTIWLDSLTAMIDWNGQRAIQVALIDITERKMNAELLEAREKKYRQTFENAPVAMFRIGRDRKLLDINRAFADMLGYDRYELVGKIGFNLIHPDDVETVRQRTGLVWAGHTERVENEYRMKRKDGTEIWVISSGNLTPDENDEPNHLIVQLQNITQRKIAEQLLQQAKESLAVSEKQYRELFDNAPVAMCWASPDGRYVRTNQAVQKMLGYSEAELLNMHPLDTLRPDRRAVALEGMKSLGIGKSPSDAISVEAPHIRKDGVEIWITVTVNLIRSEDGKPQHILVQLQDVTARKIAEEQLQAAQESLAESEKNFRELFEHAPVAISALSMTGAFLQTNRAFRDMLGYSEEELAHMTPMDVVEASQRDQARDILADAARKTTTGRINHDLQLISRTGQSIWVWLSGTVVFDKNGKPSYILSHLQDITGRKKAEAQLFRSQKMEALGNLAGGIAHDFNNMLLPIIGLTSLSKEDLPADSPIQENLDTVIEAAEKARQIVAQILTFSRQDESAVGPIATSHCINEAVYLVRNMLPSSISVIADIEPDIGTILADEAQLQSVILNLGSNAAYAIAGKAGKVSISLDRVTADADAISIVPNLMPNAAYARIRMSDTGCGMTKETLEKIFNPFFTTKPVGEGTGLGLSMVHGIIERFGGVIHVTSEVGTGTTFEIYLPLLPETTLAPARVKRNASALA